MNMPKVTLLLGFENAHRDGVFNVQNCKNIFKLKISIYDNILKIVNHVSISYSITHWLKMRGWLGMYVICYITVQKSLYIIINVSENEISVEIYKLHDDMVLKIK